MSDDDNSDDSNSSKPASTGHQRPNEVELQAGRLTVRAKGSEATEELMEQAADQMADQMRDWVTVDRQVVSQSPTTFFGGAED